MPQLKALTMQYQSDIVWCDCGSPAVGIDTASFAAEWWNQAKSQNRQVLLNNRYGIAESDFDTPEYATFSFAYRRKWESNEGMVSDA